MVSTSSSNSRFIKKDKSSAAVSNEPNVQKARAATGSSTSWAHPAHPPARGTATTSRAAAGSSRGTTAPLGLAMKKARAARGSSTSWAHPPARGAAATAASSTGTTGPLG